MAHGNAHKDGVHKTIERKSHNGTNSSATFGRSGKPGLLSRMKRHLVQLLAVLLYNLDFQGIATMSVGRAPSKGVCAPGLHCYSCPGAVAACPIGTLQQSLAAASLPMGFYVGGTILAFGALFGRTICGWACPFGFLQDLIDKAGRALHVPEVRKGLWSRRLSWLKYAVLALAIAGPLATLLASGLGKPLFCSLICPAGTLPGIALVASDPTLQAMVGTLFSWKVSLLLALVAAALFVYRPFCRFLCPLGALYGFFNRFCVLRYTVDATKCSNCGACVEICRMDVKRVGDHECIQCGTCASACEFDAIRFSVSARTRSVSPEAPISQRTEASPLASSISNRTSTSTSASSETAPQHSSFPSDTAS